MKDYEITAKPIKQTKKLEALLQQYGVKLPTRHSVATHAVRRTRVELDPLKFAVYEAAIKSAYMNAAICGMPDRRTRYAHKPPKNRPPNNPNQPNPFASDTSTRRSGQSLGGILGKPTGPSLDWLRLEQAVLSSGNETIGRPRPPENRIKAEEKGARPRSRVIGAENPSRGQ